MLTIDQAKLLKKGDVIYQTVGIDGNKLDKPIRWKVSSTIKLWKTRPDDFRIGLKHGLYNFGELTPETAKYLELKL